MKNNMTLKTVAALTTLMLTQPLMAIYSVDSKDCYAPTNIKSTTINVSEFSNVWQKLHRDNMNLASQSHLQTYIDKTLDNTKGTLDIDKFSSVWQELHSNSSIDTAHLSKYIDTLLNDATKNDACFPTPLLCNASIDVAKFSTLWNEVKVNNNQQVHLNSALSSLLDATICSI